MVYHLNSGIGTASLQNTCYSTPIVPEIPGHPEFPVNPKISENLKVLAVEVSSES
jgi:hypothetical protein